jgi:hypothetical protein
MKEYLIRVQAEVSYNGGLQPVPVSVIEDTLVDHIEGECGVPGSGVPRNIYLKYTVMKVEEIW